MFVAYALLIALFGVVCFACGMAVGLKIVEVFNLENEDEESESKTH